MTDRTGGTECAECLRTPASDLGQAEEGREKRERVGGGEVRIRAADLGEKKMAEPLFSFFVLGPFFLLGRQIDDRNGPGIYSFG